VNRPDPDATPSDDELVRLVGLALDDQEPLPLGAVEFAVGALAWRDMDAELAEVLHDSQLEEAVLLRDTSTLRLLVFQAGDVTLDIEHGADRLVGALSPPARYRVEVHSGGAGEEQAPAPATVSDEAGMFELVGAIRGAVRFVVRDGDGRVALRSPWVTL
jgi:hypothetical protein